MLFVISLVVTALLLSSSIRCIDGLSILGGRGGATTKKSRTAGTVGWGVPTRRSPTHCLYSTAEPPTPTSTTLPETTPLPPHTFAGMVEKGMVEKFGYDNVQRVVESWRLLEQGYEHKYYDEDFEIENHLYQHCHSYVPGLSIKEFWDTSEYKWCHKLASKYSQIRREFDAVTSDMSLLEEKGNNIWAGALTDDAGSYGEGWRTLVLMDRGRWDPINCALFPVTARAVHDSGAPAVEVFFTSMQPRTDIKPHSDFTNFVLTSHLGLDIPYSGENQCRLTIGKTTRQWINGQVMLFDTSLTHDAVNDSDKTRYILMLRLWHPDLSDLERQALQFTYDALEFPNLVTSDNQQERMEAEKLAIQMREFPDLQRKSSSVAVKQGFGGGGGGMNKSSTNKKKKKKGKK